MIGQIITDKDGNPMDNKGDRLSESGYQPSAIIKDLFAKVQKDFQVAWMLQHRPMREFDGVSLLQRTKIDQETFSAYVGAEYVPKHKRWRWRGRKNTARDKLIGILAHMIAGMLYPYVRAKNEKDEEDKMTGQVMRILVEDHLRKAGYETKFLYLVLSALVNPAVFCEVEYVEAMQRVKRKLESGSFEVVEAIDQLLSGLNINIIPVSDLLLGDLYSGTGKIQRLPYVIRVRRISYDEARNIYAGKHFDQDGKDLFDYVEAGQTRIVIAGQDRQTLFDVEWSEADRDFVQEITAFYRSEDLQVTWVGGVFMGEEKDVYNSNPFEHRRMTLFNEEWISVPVYPFAMSGFEPIDPSGRFAYFKSGAFKIYWDDASQNQIHRMLHDGTALETIKPAFLSGVAKVDSIVWAPGATVGMPQGAAVTFPSMSPNLVAAANLIGSTKQDMAESTQDKMMTGVTEPNVTATQSNIAVKQARLTLGVFGSMVADLVRQIGDLTVDCTIMYSTIGEIDYSVPGVLKGKYKTFLAKGKEKGKDVTHKVMFTDERMGKKYSKDQIEKKSWDLYNKTGDTYQERASSDQRIYEVDPYLFARYTYTLYVDPDQIILKSLGADRQEKILDFNMLADPRVAPYTDQKAVVEDFVIEEFGGNDPERYKRKEDPVMQEMVPGMEGGDGAPMPPGVKKNNAGMVVPAGAPVQ